MCRDFSEEEGGVDETLAAKFKTPEQADVFNKIFTKAAESNVQELVQAKTEVKSEVKTEPSGEWRSSNVRTVPQRDHFKLLCKSFRHPSDFIFFVSAVSHNKYSAMKCIYLTLERITLPKT